jgi:hypothetical protein
MRRLWFVALLVVALSSVGAAQEYPEAVFLMIFPDARTTALGGCGVALNDFDANTYYNPACLATGSRAAATWTHLPGSVGYSSNASYDFAGVACRLGERLGFAANNIYAQTGEVDVVDYRGNLVGTYRPFDLATSISAAYHFLPCLSAGVTAKAIYRFLYPDWAARMSPEMPIDGGAEGLTFACDGGVQYRPSSSLQLGLVLANIGPDLVYTSSGETDPLPAILRFGFALRPRIPGPVEVALVGDIWRDLVTPIEYWGGEESALMFWENMRDGLGFELRVAKLASLRLGYFEDIQDQTGGILVGEGYGTRRISLLRYLVEHHTKPQDVGWCWGVGLEYRGLKFDVGVDESIYDFATRNVRFQLSARL